MIITNPFTRQVLNTEHIPNPEGCNQHTGPDCGVGSRHREFLTEVSDFSELERSLGRELGKRHDRHSVGKLGIPAYITDDDELLNLGPWGEHELEPMEYPEDVGLSQEFLDDHYRGESENTVVDELRDKGFVRMRVYGDEAFIDAGDVSLSRIKRLIDDNKIPMSKKYILDVDGPKVSGEFSLDDVLQARTWEHLKALDRRRGK